MNVHLNPFIIWNSYSFQPEIPELLLGLENKQPCHFLLNPTLHKFLFSVQVYFYLQQHGQNVNFHHVYYSYIVVLWGKATLN